MKHSLQILCLTPAGALFFFIGFVGEGPLSAGILRTRVNKVEDRDERKVVPKGGEDSVMVFDLHCDTIYNHLENGVDLYENNGHVDIVRMREGNYLAQVFAIWVAPGKGWETVRKMAQVLWKWKSDYSNYIALATTGTEILKAKMEGKIAGILGIEGLRPFEGEVERLKEIYEFGVRVLGLTWFDSNEFAGSSNPKDKLGNYGLTAKGIELVKVANKLGMVIDVSHASDRTVVDVARYSSRPFIASHSCAKKLREHERNLSDELLKLIALRGGVIGVNYHTGYVSDKPRRMVRISDVIEHIVYISKVAGIDHVACGSDFDGSHPPDDLSGADRVKVLARMLLKRGFSLRDVRKIMYLNALRVFTDVTENKKLGDLPLHQFIMSPFQY